MSSKRALEICKLPNSHYWRGLVRINGIQWIYRHPCMFCWRPLIFRRRYGHVLPMVIFFFTHKTTDTMTWKPLTYAITVSSSINHPLYQFQLRQNPPWVFVLSYPELRGLCWHYPRKFTSLLRISPSWHTGGTPLNAASKYVSLSTFATWFQTSLPTFFLCFLSTSTSKLPVKGRASRLHKRLWVPSEPVYKCFTRHGTLKLKLV